MGRNVITTLKGNEVIILPRGSGNVPLKEVYQKGISNMESLISRGILAQDEQANLYVYAQTMNGRTQYGIVGCAHVLDYLNNAIKRHELTRPDKEEDRKDISENQVFMLNPFFLHTRPIRS